MNTIDQPSKWIVKMFKFNLRETGGAGCQYFEEGIQGEAIGLQSTDLVFGIMRIDEDMYFFTDKFLVINNGIGEIGWGQVREIEGAFRSEHKKVAVNLIDGRAITLPMAKFPYRIQQLIYQLIEWHSSKNLLPRFQGPKAIREVFDLANTEVCKRVGLALDRLDVAFAIPISAKKDVILYNGEFNEEELYIYPSLDVDFLIVLSIENRHIPLLVCDPGKRGKYDECDFENSFFKELDAEKHGIQEIICIYSYSIEANNEGNMETLEPKGAAIDPNENYSSMGIYFMKGGKLVKLAECEVE